MKRTKYRVLKKGVPVWAQGLLLNDALNTNITQTPDRQLNLPRTVNLGTSDDEFTILNLDGTEKAEQPIEDGLGATEKAGQPIEDGLGATEKAGQPIEDGLGTTEKAEQPIEDGLGATEKPEQPIEDSLDATEKPEQPIEDKLNQSTNAKIFYDSYGGIRRRNQASTGDDFGSTGANQQPNEDGQRLTREDDQSDDDSIQRRNERRVIKNRIALKVRVFDSTTFIVGMFSSLSAILFGFENIGECPANLHMPYAVFIIGLLSLFLLGYISCHTMSLPSEVIAKNFDCLGRYEQTVIEWLFWLFVCLWTCEAGHFFCMAFDVSFDPSADNYCNYWFFTYTIIMNVLAFLSSFIGWALLYDRNDKFLNDLERGVANLPRSDCEWMLMDTSSDSE